MKFTSIFNIRTFFVLLASQLAAFLTIYFDIKFDIDVILFGLAIAFPLAFSMQAAFKRRDRALEYFSRFRSGTVTLEYSFRISEDLATDKKAEIRKIIFAMSEQLIHQLEQRVISYKPMQGAVDKIMEFIERNREGISNRNMLRMIRYIGDITESSAYLISLVRHRTMAGIRFYAITFISIFPFIQAPIMYYRLETFIPAWTIHLIVAFTSLVLVTLSNFQRQIEYPFDPKGIDNIHVQDFMPDVNG